MNMHRTQAATKTPGPLTLVQFGHINPMHREKRRWDDPPLWTSCLNPVGLRYTAGTHPPRGDVRPRSHITIGILTGVWNPARHLVYVPPRINPIHRENAPPSAKPAEPARVSPVAPANINPIHRENAAPSAKPAAPERASPIALTRLNPMHREDMPPSARQVAPGQASPVVPANINPIHRENPLPRGTGPLRNGNHRGDLSAVLRCGCKTRLGRPCRSPAMRNGRCRMHGGASTGPRTPEGRARIAAARTKHGFYNAENRGFRRGISDFLTRSRQLLAAVRQDRNADPASLLHLLRLAVPRNMGINLMHREERRNTDRAPPRTPGQPQNVDFAEPLPHKPAIRLSPAVRSPPEAGAPPLREGSRSGVFAVVKGPPSV